MTADNVLYIAPDIKPSQVWIVPVFIEPLNRAPYFECFFIIHATTVEDLAAQIRTMLPRIASRNSELRVCSRVEAHQLPVCAVPLLNHLDRLTMHGYTEYILFKNDCASKFHLRVEGNPLVFDSSTWK